MRKNNSIKGIINMVGNPFQCSCTLVSEITRIQTSKVKVTSLNSTQDHLSCILQNGTRIPFSQVVEQLISFCHAYSDVTPIVFFYFCLSFVFDCDQFIETEKSFRSSNDCKC